VRVAEKISRRGQSFAARALARTQANAQVTKLPGGVSDRHTASADSISIQFHALRFREKSMKLDINGQVREVDADPDMPLLWAIRDIVGLTGTKFGCGMAQCGACTVHQDGVAIRSCITPISDVEGTKITTIEGLNGKVAEAVQAAWAQLDVPQCGYCQSGQVMAATALLTDNPKPTDADIDAAMSGNLCRCATYQRIRAGIHEAAKALG
jgi:isoquinoline 1-oxidoreductase alpha subunit